VERTRRLTANCKLRTENSVAERAHWKKPSSTAKVFKLTNGGEGANGIGVVDGIHYYKTAVQSKGT
jgi:hypothetical protein